MGNDDNRDRVEMQDNGSKMTEIEREQIADLHAYFFQGTPGVKSSITRAQRLDEIVRAYESGSFIMRMIIYLSAFVAAAGGLLAFLKSYS